MNATARALDTLAEKHRIRPDRRPYNQDSYDRPDYDRLSRLANAQPSAHLLATIARQLLLDGQTGTRLFNECICGYQPPESVITILARAAAESPVLTLALTGQVWPKFRGGPDLPWLDFPKHYHPDGTPRELRQLSLFTA
jgi:hypothetical protein